MYKIFLDNRPLTFKRVFESYEQARSFARTYVRKRFPEITWLYGYTDSGTNPALDVYGISIRKTTKTRG